MTSVKSIIITHIIKININPSIITDTYFILNPSIFKIKHCCAVVDAINYMFGWR